MSAKKEGGGEGTDLQRISKCSGDGSRPQNKGIESWDISWSVSITKIVIGPLSPWRMPQVSKRQIYTTRERNTVKLTKIIAGLKYRGSIWTHSRLQISAETNNSKISFHISVRSQFNIFAGRQSSARNTRISSITASTGEEFPMFQNVFKMMQSALIWVKADENGSKEGITSIFAEMDAKDQEKRQLDISKLCNIPLINLIGK